MEAIKKLNRIKLRHSVKLALKVIFFKKDHS